MPYDILEPEPKGYEVLEPEVEDRDAKRQDLIRQMAIARGEGEMGRFTSGLLSIPEAIAYQIANAGAKVDPAGVVRNMLQRTGYQPTGPIVPPEVFKPDVSTVSQFVREGLGNMGINVPEPVRAGGEQFVAEQASGLTDPGVIVPGATAKTLPRDIGRMFQAQMLSALPENIMAYQQAASPEEKVRTGLGLAANVALPAVIELGISRTPAKAETILPRAAAEAEKGVAENAIQERGAEALPVGETPGDRGKVVEGTPGAKEPAIPQGQEEVPRTEAGSGRLLLTDKEKEIQARIPRLTDESLRITVSRDPALPAADYVQVDEVPGDKFSSNPETLRKLGYEMPSSAELLKLPRGQYTLAQAREMLKKTEPPATGQERILLRQFGDLPKGTVVTLTGEKSLDPINQWVGVKLPSGEIAHISPASISAKELPIRSLPQLLGELGEEKLGNLISYWDQNAELSPDKKTIIGVQDPRNPTAKARLSTRDFIKWLSSDEGIEAQAALKKAEPPPPVTGEAPQLKPEAVRELSEIATSKPWYLGYSVVMPEVEAQFYFPTKAKAVDVLGGVTQGERIQTLGDLFADLADRAGTTLSTGQKGFQAYYQKPPEFEGGTEVSLDLKNPMLIREPYGYSFDEADLMAAVRQAIAKGHDGLVILNEGALPKDVLKKLDAIYEHPQYGISESLDAESEALKAANLKKIDWQNGNHTIITFDRTAEKEPAPLAFSEAEPLAATPQAAPRQPVPTGAAPEGERAPAVSAAEPPGTTKGDISAAKEQVPVAGAAPPAGTTPLVAAAEGAAPGEQYGIAQRVRERLAAEGRTAPVEPGQGVAADVEVARGQQLNAANPGLAQKLLTDFEADPQKRVSADMIASTRAHGQELYKAVLDAEQKYGPNSPQYKAAWDAHSDWYTRTKPMQTEWHKMGQAQQGEVDVNTGTFTGLNQVSLDATGKGLSDKAIPKAKLVAKGVSNADAKAKQAVINWHREWAIARAKAEVKGMVTEAKAARKAAEAERARKKKVLDDLSAIHRRLVAEAAKAETAAAVARAGREKKAAEAARKIAQKKADAISAKVRRAASDAAKAEVKALGDPIGTVQKKAKEIIDRQSPDKGMIEPSDLINQIASDLNMPPRRVRDLLAQDKRSKYLMDEAWKKQLIARNLRTQAKVWAATRNIEPYKRALARIPRLMFSLKVGLHGTVALGTHVPMVAFQPTFWKPYVQNFGRMYRMVGQPAYHQMQMNDLVRRPNWTTARRAGLVNDPFQFEDYNSPQTTVSFGRLTGMGNRGYSVLKIIRQDMFDQHFDRLPDRLRKIPEVAAEIANNVNHATGVVKGRAPKGTNIGLFAPRLEASRVMWLLGDPIKAADTFLRWDKANEGEKWAAKQVLKERAWVLGTMSGLLALNQGFLKAIDSEQEINWDNPMKSDWLKFKVAGMNIGYGNAMISMARLPARMGVAIVNEGKFSKIVYEDENVYKILGSYARSQASPFAGALLDFGFGRDYAERPLPRAGYGFLEGKTNLPKRLRAQGITEPYSWVEYGAKTAAFIPLQEGLVEGWQAMEDVWNGMGISEEEQKRLAKALVIIGAMAGTGARVTEDVRY